MQSFLRKPRPNPEPAPRAAVSATGAVGAGATRPAAHAFADLPLERAAPPSTPAAAPPVVQAMFRTPRASKDESGSEEPEVHEDSSSEAAVTTAKRKKRSKKKRARRRKKRALSTAVAEEPGSEESSPEPEKRRKRRRKKKPEKKEIPESSDEEIHEPGTPGSPFTASQQEEVDFLDSPTRGRKLERIKEDRDWPQRKLYGQLGEDQARRLYESQGATVVDANDVLGYNTAGIDTLTDREKPFSQSKLHLSKSTRDPKTYEAEIDRRDEMAEKLAKQVLKDTPRGAESREELRKLAKKTKNPALKRLSGHFNENWIGETDLSRSVDGNDPVSVIADHMEFPVPREIYPQLSSEHREHAVALPWDTRTLHKVSHGVRFKRTKPKTEEEKDPGYEPAED